ncbi:3-phosphoglycerate kinase [Pseudomonas sp. CFBP13508]|uniref:3-phosphoglycerate kinase n=1 Tax=Pseudomonas sp. CFBP13508 TaxID=2184009 RepID=UPI0010C11C39|nr:3-phosphoglycerate kinase [Pseudomonas sp. CFBP13508]TKJ65179.1 3-phosphoglycerate kinase [Pseudomonas sp. CFBP13508]
MKKFCCVVLALLPLTAFAYPIDMQKDLNGMKIDYETYDTDNDIGSIRVANYGDVDATCRAVFSNGPEAPRTRSIDVPAGKHKNATAKFTREIIKLRIKLTCTPK